LTVQIIINGDNAAESLKELSTLAAGIGATAINNIQKSEDATPIQQPYASQPLPPTQAYAPTAQPQGYSYPVQGSAVPIAPPIQPAFQQQPPAQPTAVPTTTGPSYTMEQLSVAATPLVDAGRGHELAGWLNQKGFAALTQLPKELYGEFANYLRSLGVQI
jgi:hypothetical protein